MRLNQFEFLVAIDKCGSISQAAQELFISQPTLSLAVKELEEELGVTILNRGKKGVAFTPPGELVLQRAKAIMAEIESVREIKLETMGNVYGKVRLGAGSHFCASLLTEVMIDMRRHYPEVILSLKRNYSKEIIKSIALKELEIGLIQLTTADESDIFNELRRNALAFQVLFTDKMRIMVGRNHPLMGRQGLTVDDVLPYTVATIKDKMDEFTYNILKARGYSKQPVSIGDVAMMRRYVEKTDSMTIIPNKEIANSNRVYETQLYPLDIVDFDNALQVGWVHDKSQMTLAEERVIDSLQAACAAWTATA